MTIFPASQEPGAELLLLLLFLSSSSIKPQKKVIFCFQMPRKHESNLRLVGGRHSTAAFEGLILHLAARLQAPNQLQPPPQDGVLV